ncbi:MAG: hypothetical protein A2487_12670 [Candidatus Raymondbacteria bacterium RifOxyC12_full_50_8]|uniref:Uncharacterized protein n=1 Tax=Candidatus Raymondbacteria bacterium RIFOXYD12_FULL_49_13 TaxID=1817890 RepID=A0A1F7FCT0_UNCRA|nr:MAG: hypothetical protein A2248_03090 [Candidatus Raymondbacteria bacterium RIFOXYA2_FULL_49_16]OGJ93464.1 MAG: hypothetical protein A2350_19010 [Candidatus Raymondbacteria bacterium RifOxyB12_full_50_8]OGK04277.1 MAG: hypothetical protein A2519_18115 [Candidatus Raymondbacteria bacterium RIFOXYD12_FULL_49_13]OGK07973.1 MAG: hypothetical protein A2487_12670 [Candidatus Raymondbacteria bacterium RifOxyC12_full_50_8]OGP42440.1 MAG: hypothetical protein A2324_17125 [Candidatus Raymondbacteria b
MTILVYSLCSLAILKIIIDVVDHSNWIYYSFSVLIEQIMYLFIIAMIIRTYFKQREGRRELLQRRVQELNQKLNEVK